MAGTPATSASVPPPRVTDTARPIWPSGTSREAYAATIAQKRPCATPPTMRTATSIQYSGTNAEASVVSPSTASTATRRPCRGIRLVSAVSGVDVMTTVKANTDMSRPMNGSATPRPPLISGSRPVGSISIVMDRKTPAASMRRPGQGSRGARTRADSVTDIRMSLRRRSPLRVHSPRGSTTRSCARPGPCVVRRPRTSLPDALLWADDHGCRPHPPVPLGRDARVHRRARHRARRERRDRRRAGQHHREPAVRERRTPGASSCACRWSRPRAAPSSRRRSRPSSNAGT